MSGEGALARLGAALRFAWRPIPLSQLRHTYQEKPPSPDFATACNRVRTAAQSLEIVSALAMNPVDVRALDAGIDVALRRLSEDIH